MTVCGGLRVDLDDGSPTLMVYTLDTSYSPSVEKENMVRRQHELWHVTPSPPQTQIGCFPKKLSGKEVGTAYQIDYRKKKANRKISDVAIFFIFLSNDC